MQKNRRYKTISLFSGCGGLDLGFVGGFNYLNKRYPKNRFDIIYANDIDKSSCVTLKNNFGHNAICGDILEILSGKKDLFGYIEIPSSADIVLGGFPCQDFSYAGKRKGFSAKRGRLYKSMIRVIKKTNPALFLAENVKGLLTIHDGKAIKMIENDFQRLGYNISTKLYLAADYGVPQSRERVIIIGTNKKMALDVFNHPNEILEPKKWVTLKEAIGDLENLEEGAIANHYWSKAKMFPGTQGNGFVNKERVGPTMRAEHHGNIEWHWNKKRRLSAREAARIQSFPDDFIFYPSTSSAYKQIGNAVPPVMAWYIARHIQKFLDKNLN